MLAGYAGEGRLVRSVPCIDIAASRASLARIARIDRDYRIADGFVSFSAENNKGETQRDAKAVAVGISGAATKIAASIREKISLIEAAIAEGKDTMQ